MPSSRCVLAQGSAYGNNENEKQCARLEIGPTIEKSTPECVRAVRDFNQTRSRPPVIRTISLFMRARPRYVGKLFHVMQ